MLRHTEQQWWDERASGTLSQQRRKQRLKKSVLTHASDTPVAQALKAAVLRKR